jgi:hypothetical protein
VSPHEHDDQWRTSGLLALGDEFARLERDQLQVKVPPSPSRTLPRWGTAVGAVAVAALAAVVLVVALTQQASRALADVRGVVAAAEKAKTFTFASNSVLDLDDRKPQVTVETGAVDLAAPAYRVRVAPGETGVGFERLVFTHALYVRPITASAARSWIGVRLSPAAVIAPSANVSNGVGDPLGLLEVLSQSKGAVRVAHQRLDGVLTVHYRLRSTLGAFLRAQNQSIAARLAASPVLIDVWLDEANRVLLARRQFQVGGSRHASLSITTSFAAYGKPVALSAPGGVSTNVVESLNPVAGDPVSASLLAALKLGSRHPGSPAIHPQHR